MADTHSATPETPGPEPDAKAGRRLSPFNDVRWNRLYHRLTGLVPAALFFILLLAKTEDVVEVARDSGSYEGSAPFFAALIAAMSRALFLALLVVVLLIRREPVNRSAGILPRIVAVAGTSILGLLALLPDSHPNLAQAVIGLSLIEVGTVLSIVATRDLGRSFSILAEARSLVTHGAYRWVRHPVYLAEEIAAIGVVIQAPSPWAFALVAVHLVLQIRRMDYEEAVLLESFPEYADYMAGTYRLIPGLY